MERSEQSTDLPRGRGDHGKFTVVLQDGALDSNIVPSSAADGRNPFRYEKRKVVIGEASRTPKDWPPLLDRGQSKNLEEIGVLWRFTQLVDRLPWQKHPIVKPSAISFLFQLSEQ